MHSKGKHQQNERQPTEWEKIFANPTTNKGLISKIYKQVIELYTKNSNPIKKWAQDLNRPHEKVLNITKYKKCKSNHNEVSPQTGQNGYHHKVHK